MFTQQQLKEVFDYDAVNGQLIRKNKNRRKNPADHKPIYSNISIGRKTFSEHKAIWIWHNGAIPEGLFIDHIDGNIRNNRIENLRLCTKSQNAMNRNRPTCNVSGFKGVSVTPKGKFLARIKVGGDCVPLGLFDKPEDAAKAYDEAATHYFGEFAKTNKSMNLI